MVLDYLVSMRSLSGSENRGVLLSGRTYSTSGVFIALSRRAFGYIHSYYIPSGLLVIVSWTSFLIPPEIVAGRMAMLVTLFLCLINMFLSTIKYDVGMILWIRRTSNIFFLLQGNPCFDVSDGPELLDDRLSALRLLGADGLCLPAVQDQAKHSVEQKE